MRTLKNKKGIAIEMAVVFMLVVFLLCMVIMTMSMYVSSQSGKFVNDSKARALFDEVGERFIGLIKYDPDEVTTEQLSDRIADLELDENYEIMVYGNAKQGFTLYIYDTSHKKNVLLVSAQYNEETKDCDILQWSYNP